MADNNSKNYEYIFSIINQIESSIPVHNWIIKGIHIWPYIRRMLFIQMYGVEKKLKQKKLASLYYRARSLTRLLNPIYWLRLAKRHDVILCSDGVSMTYINNQYYDVYCYPLEQELKKNSYSILTISPIENIYEKGYKHSLPFDCFENLASGFSALINHFNKSVDLESYSKFVEILRNYSIDENNFNLKRIHLISYKIYYLKKILISVFKKIKPKICFIVSYYSTFGYAFNAACKTLKIHSIDIQHGTQNGICDAYNRWHNFPENGYPELPSLFWTWRDYDASLINTWAVHTKSKHYAFTGGHPWINLWRGDNSTAKYYDNKINVLKKNILNNTHAIDILVTLQVGSVDHRNYWLLLSNVINTFGTEVRWWLRQHPISKLHQHPENFLFQKIKNKYIDIKNASEIPLYALLRNMDLHVTVESNTAIEASFFGLHTIFISHFAYESFDELIQRKFASVHVTKTEIINAIVNYKKNKMSEFPISNQLNNIKELITKYTQAREVL